MIKYDGKDWLRVTFSWKGTSLTRVWLRVVVVGVLTAALAAAKTFGVEGFALNPLGHTLIGIALGLLLVFRNNASYERYWEGRKAWGSLVNTSRNLARSAAAYAGGAEVVARLIGAYAAALKHHLRGMGDGEKEDSRPELANFLDPAQLDTVTVSPNPPSAVALSISSWIRDALAAGRIAPEQALQMESLVAEFLNCQGACERIVKTPIPFCHAAHIKLLLMIYVLTLPFVVAPLATWMAIPMCMVVAFGLIGIEEAGVEIEDPFGSDPNDLPLEDMCATIARDSAELVALGDRSRDVTVAEASPAASAPQRRATASGLPTGAAWNA